MWIMIITLIYWGNPQQVTNNASIATVEFSSKDSCEAARTVYLDQVKKVTDPINDFSRKKWEQGTASKTAIEWNVVCVCKNNKRAGLT